jgi:hypothetical protein
MSFDKYYPNRKDQRKPYYRSGKYDSSCRPHGGCKWCENNRLIQERKEMLRVKEILRDFINGEYDYEDAM